MSTDNKNAVKEAKRRRSSFIRGRKIHSPLEVCQSERLAAVQGITFTVYKYITNNQLMVCDPNAKY
jgi:hypothetical protein